MKTVFIIGLLLTLCTADSHNYHKTLQFTQHNTRDYPYANLDQLFRSGTNYQQTQNVQYGAIRNAQSTIITPSRSIDSLFLRLPSSTELDELVLSADSVAILKTIQTVATDDSLPCDQRIAYLFEILGRIRCAIEKKQFAADQLQVIIQGAFEQIKRLQESIAQLQEEKKHLGLDENRSKLKKLIKELEDVYNKFNRVQGDIAPKEAQVAGYEKEIKILIKCSDSQRNRIAQDKLKLSETESIIRNLENQLRAAKNRKNSLQVSIKKSETVIEENDRRIDQSRAKIRQLEEQIANLRDNTDALRVQRLRTDISVAEAKEDKINSLIDRYIDNINMQKKKCAEDQLDDLNHMIEVLKEFIQTTRKEIDRHYYYCYGQGSVQVQQTGGVIVYVVKGQRFGQYIHNAYGKSVKIPANQHNGDVQLQVVDVFGPAWTNKYGYPFVSNPNKSDLEFQGNFNCLNPSAARSGHGVISAIEADYIYASTDDGRNQKLRIGTCTRIECSTQIPKVGQSLYYTGVPSGDIKNLYKASCL